MGGVHAGEAVDPAKVLGSTRASVASARLYWGASEGESAVPRWLCVGVRAGWGLGGPFRGGWQKG